MSKLLIYVNGGPAFTEPVALLYWSEEELWKYMVNCKDDPLEILSCPLNKYAIGRAKVFGLKDERRASYGRE